MFLFLTFNVSAAKAETKAAKASASTAKEAETKKTESKKTSEADDNAPYMKVIKVDKNQALVVFSKKRSALKVGQIGYLVSKVGDDDVEVPTRGHFMGLESTFSLLKISNKEANITTKDDKSDFNLKFIYGVNKEKFEYGVTLGYSFVKGQSNGLASDKKTISVGGLFDLNFARNVIEQDVVVGARLIVAAGQVDDSSRSKPGSESVIEPGIIIKYFGLSSNIATTAKIGYNMTTIKYDALSTTLAGTVGQIGIQSYF
jgi:hypothetical protein